MAEERVSVDLNAGDAIIEVLLKVIKNEAYLAAVLRNQAKIRAQLETRSSDDVLQEIVDEIDAELPSRIEFAFQNLDIPQGEIDNFLEQGLSRRRAASFTGREQ